jgi:hypothetical protein
MLSRVTDVWKPNQFKYLYDRSLRGCSNRVDDDYMKTALLTIKLTFYCSFYNSAAAPSGKRSLHCRESHSNHTR